MKRFTAIGAIVTEQRPPEEWPSASDLAAYAQHRSNVSQALAHARLNVNGMKPSRETSLVLTKIEEALMWLEKTP
jgi:hypothetical protein